MLTPLEQWDHDIGYHLAGIRVHAQLIVSHANSMTRRPVWATQAEEELEKCDAALANALAQVSVALRTIREKPVDE